MMRVFSSSSKQLWCFDCNMTQSVCLHKACPEHCDICNRIKEIRSNRSILQVTDVKAAVFD